MNMVAAGCLSCQIVVFQYMYDIVVIKLMEWENHKYQQDRLVRIVGVIFVILFEFGFGVVVVSVFGIGRRRHVRRLSVRTVTSIGRTVIVMFVVLFEENRKYQQEGSFRVRA